VVLDMQPVQGLVFLHRIGSHFDNRALCKDVVRFAIAFGVGVVAAPLLLDKLAATVAATDEHPASAPA
jgi:hypothetical protein